MRVATRSNPQVKYAALIEGVFNKICKPQLRIMNADYELVSQKIKNHTYKHRDEFMSDLKEIIESVKNNLVDADFSQENSKKKKGVKIFNTEEILAAMPKQCEEELSQIGGLLEPYENKFAGKEEPLEEVSKQKKRKHKITPRQALSDPEQEESKPVEEPTPEEPKSTPEVTDAKPERTKSPKAKRTRGELNSPVQEEEKSLFPLKIDEITVLSIGHLPAFTDSTQDQQLKRKYHRMKKGNYFIHPYPIGYKIQRNLFGHDCVLSISEGPKFHVTVSESGVTFNGSSPTEACDQFCREVAKKNKNPKSGPSLFGFDVELIRRLMATIPSEPSETEKVQDSPKKKQKKNDKEETPKKQGRKKKTEVEETDTQTEEAKKEEAPKDTEEDEKPKKRGRKKKIETEETSKKEELPEEDEKPKKRGRKKKEEQVASPTKETAEAPVQEQEKPKKRGRKKNVEEEKPKEEAEVAQPVEDEKPKKKKKDAEPKSPKTKGKRKAKEDSDEEIEKPERPKRKRRKYSNEEDEKPKLTVADEPTEEKTKKKKKYGSDDSGDEDFMPKGMDTDKSPPSTPTRIGVLPPPIVTTPVRAILKTPDKKYNKSPRNVAFSPDTLDLDKLIPCPICQRPFSKYQMKPHMNKKHFNVNSDNEELNKTNEEFRAKKPKYIADIKKTVMEMDREKQRLLKEHQASLKNAKV
jgi:hypothetical protein